MTHPHEHDDRELVSTMERALAAAVSSAAALVEVYMRRQQRTAERGARATTTAVQRPADQREVGMYRAAADHAALTHTQARHALGVGQSDPYFWETASDQAVAQAVREAFGGVDPAMVGDRETDLHWIHRADPGELLPVYETAQRWQQINPSADQLADHIDEALASYGLDTSAMLTMPRDEAAERIAVARAQYWAGRGQDDPSTERDRTLIAGELAAADRADRLAAGSDSGTEPTAGEGEGIDEADATTRVGEVLSAAVSHPDGEAAHAAAVAVHDHPTHPGDAARTGRAKAPKAKRSRARTGDRDRGIGK